jgi:hypothetical protein
VTCISEDCENAANGCITMHCPPKAHIATPQVSGLQRRLEEEADLLEAARNQLYDYRQMVGLVGVFVERCSPLDVSGPMFYGSFNAQHHRSIVRALLVT